jgi:hypothetical protein
LIGAGFIAGVGFYDKINFSWFILALLVVGFIAYLVDKRRPKLSLWTSVGTIIAGLVATLPFWIYNLYYKWPFLKRINQEMSLNDYIALAPQRTKVLAGLINGDGPSWLYFTSADLVLFPIEKTLYLPLFLGALTIVLIVAIIQKQWHLLFLPGMIGLVALQIFATPKGIGLHHWTMIHPLPHLVVGIAIHQVWSELSQARQTQRRIGQAVLSLIILIVVGVNCRVVSSYHQLFEKTGGSGFFSAAIYDLSETLVRNYPNRPLQLMDWGLNHTLFFLSSGKLYTNEPFWELVGNNQTDAAIRQLIENPENVFIFNVPSSALYPQVYEQFHRVVNSSGNLNAREFKINDRRSIWSYSIIEVKICQTDRGQT